jgi:hypothetical protein
VWGKANGRCNIGVCASSTVARHVQRLQISIAKVVRGVFRVTGSVMAFVLLEPCAGKLASTVPRGLGAGNRVWLPYTSGGFPAATVQW